MDFAVLSNVCVSQVLLTKYMACAFFLSVLYSHLPNKYCVCMKTKIKIVFAIAVGVKQLSMFHVFQSEGTIFFNTFHLWLTFTVCCCSKIYCIRLDCSSSTWQCSMLYFTQLFINLFELFYLYQTYKALCSPQKLLPCSALSFLYIPSTSPVCHPIHNGTNGKSSWNPHLPFLTVSCYFTWLVILFQ